MKVIAVYGPERSGKSITIDELLKYSVFKVIEYKTKDCETPFRCFDIKSPVDSTLVKRIATLRDGDDSFIVNSGFKALGEFLAMNQLDIDVFVIAVRNKPLYLIEDVKRLCKSNFKLIIQYKAGLKDIDGVYTQAEFDALCADINDKDLKLLIDLIFS